MNFEIQNNYEKRPEKYSGRFSSPRGIKPKVLYR